MQNNTSVTHQESALLVAGQMSASVLRRDLVGTLWHPLQSILRATRMNLLFMVHSPSLGAVFPVLSMISFPMETYQRKVSGVNNTSHYHSSSKAAADTPRLPPLFLILFPSYSANAVQAVLFSVVVYNLFTKGYETMITTYFSGCGHCPCPLTIKFSQQHAKRHPVDHLRTNFLFLDSPIVS